MKVSEAAVFRWVVIVLIAALAVILMAVVAGSLAGAILGLALVLVAAWHCYRWVARKWRGG